jgi:uncharacterized membrane protein
MELTQTTSYPPTIGDSYGNGWKQLWKYFLELLLIGIVSFLLGLPMSLPSWFGNLNFDLEQMENSFALPPNFYSYILFIIAYAVLVINPLQYGIKYAYLKAARGEKVEVRDMFSFTANYVNAVLASLLTGFIIGLGFVFLIIPGIVFACKLAFVPYLVIDKKMEVIQALKTSWNMTDGHAVDIFVMGLMTIPIFIIGFCALFIGIIPAIMWISMAFASIYHAVDRQQAPKI